MFQVLLRRIKGLFAAIGQKHFWGVEDMEEIGFGAQMFHFFKKWNISYM